MSNMYTCVRLSGGSRAAAVAAGGCREEVEGDGASCVDAARPVTRLSDSWPPLCMLLSGGPARPLGYLRAEIPTRGEPGPSTPGPPREVGLPAGWADTGSASSVDIDSDYLRPQPLALQIY